MITVKNLKLIASTKEMEVLTKTLRDYLELGIADTQKIDEFLIHLNAILKKMENENAT